MNVLLTNSVGADKDCRGPGGAGRMQPAAKTIVKGGVLVYDKAREIVAEAGEQMGGLGAEARAAIDRRGRREDTALRSIRGQQRHPPNSRPIRTGRHACAPGSMCQCHTAQISRSAAPPS
jgi:hypothetical protein